MKLVLCVIPQKNHETAMKILMSAFACAPNEGSEPEIGWRWALETARMGHDVLVLTSADCRQEIEREINQRGIPQNLSFDMFMPPLLQKVQDIGIGVGLKGVTYHVVHLIWQLVALRHVRRHFRGRQFDLVHHVTFAMIRHPTMLNRLGLPLVLGPLGGGERAPMALRRDLSWRPWLQELLRDVHTWLTRFDPVSRPACRAATIIFARTRETKNALPKRWHNKTLIHLGLGIDVGPVPKPPMRAPGEPLRLVFAGRILEWKGLHLAIEALAIARAKGADAELAVVGSGPAVPRLKVLARKLDVDPFVTWRGVLPRSELMNLYSSQHVLLFPSLHDSGGMVVLESLSRGLPVICLALGGPAEIVNSTCGRVVPVHGGKQDCKQGLSHAILELAANEILRYRLGRAALCRANELTWPAVVGQAYAEIGARLSELKVSPP
jgi:glycosyltransferase involved in cell wall biosynthesis